MLAPSSPGKFTGESVIQPTKARNSSRPARPPAACPPARKNSAPLPNPVLAQLCAVPDPAPPYDEQDMTDSLDATATPDWVPARSPAGTSQAQRPPAPREQRPPAPREQPARAPSVRRGQSETGAWPSQFAQILAETLVGSRPPRQLNRWTTERARSHIRRLGPLLAADTEPRIRRIVASTPSAGVVEMAVVVRFGSRVRALAVRLEHDRSAGPCGTGWKCTAVEAA